MKFISLFGRKRFFKNLVQCYKNFFGEKLISIVLFGSQARMDSHSESDYDIFIITKDLPPNRLKRTFLIRKPIAAKFKEKICTISKTPEEFEGGFPSLYLDLAIDGKILYDKDGYFRDKKDVIEEIIRSSGLVRRKIENEFSWEWIKRPIGGWAIDWSGFHALPKRGVV